MTKKVKPFTFVTATDLEKPEQFVIHLLTAVLSLKTMEVFQDQAVKKGFMNNDELQKCEFIRYDLGKLIATYNDLFSKISERYQFDTTEVIGTFRAATLAQAKEMVEAGDK